MILIRCTGSVPWLASQQCNLCALHSLPNFVTCCVCICVLQGLLPSPLILQPDGLARSWVLLGDREARFSAAPKTADPFGLCGRNCGLLIVSIPPDRATSLWWIVAVDTRLAKQQRWWFDPSGRRHGRRISDRLVLDRAQTGAEGGGLSAAASLVEFTVAFSFADTDTAPVLPPLLPTDTHTLITV